MRIISDEANQLLQYKLKNVNKLNPIKMKTFIQIVVLALMTSMVYGQDITGQWNGALRIQGNEIRIVLHINKVSNQYEATLDSPDQNVNGIKVTTTNFSYPTVKLEISSLEATYEGTLSDKNISGKWMQSGTALFLSLIRKEDVFQKVN